MWVADTVAIVSIVSGAAVAISVPFINARLERRRIDQQARESRLDELRALLDRATQHINTAWTTLYDIEQTAETELPATRILEFGAELGKEVGVLVEDGLAIRLRTPDGSPIAWAHEDMQNVLSTYEVDYRRYVEEGGLDNNEIPPRSPTAQAAEAMTAFIKEVRAFVVVE